MQESLFREFIKGLFPELVANIAQKETDSGKKYLYEEMLRLRYSPTFTFSVEDIASSNISASWVDDGSPLPVKERDQMQRITGTIPEMGIALKLTKVDLKRIQAIVNECDLNVEEDRKRAIRAIIEDVPKVVSGIHLLIEATFLSLISRGTSVIPRYQNDGKEVAILLPFDPDKIYKASVAWGDDKADPYEDVVRIIEEEEAKGNYFEAIMIHKSKLRVLRASNGAKDIVSGSSGQAFARSSSPTEKAFIEAFADEHNIKIVPVTGRVPMSRKGNRSTVEAFEENTVVFLPNYECGYLHYSKLVEEDNQAKCAEYAKAGEFTLVTKYSTPNPLIEYTLGQAAVIPIPENCKRIALLKTNEALEISPDEVEGDENITVFGKQLVKNDVIAAMNQIEVRTPHNISDKKLIENIGLLSLEKENQLKTVLKIDVGSGVDEE